LIAKLKTAIFIFDTKESLADDFCLEEYNTHIIDKESFEASISEGQDLNALFSALSEMGIHVKSMRNKSNRLEELFLSLVKERE